MVGKKTYLTLHSELMPSYCSLRGWYARFLYLIIILYIIASYSEILITFMNIACAVDQPEIDEAPKMANTRTQWLHTTGSGSSITQI